jgi:hypothetical protein
MKVTHFITYRSDGRGVNYTDNRVRVTIDCSVNEFNQYFRDEELRKIKVAGLAIEACKKFEEFHCQVFATGFPLEIKGKPINHTTLNDTYDMVYEVLHSLEK